MNLNYNNLIKLKHRNKKIDIVVYTTNKDYKKIIFNYDNIPVNINTRNQNIIKSISALCDFIDLEGYEGYINLKEKLKKYNTISSDNIVLENYIYEIVNIVKEFQFEGEVALIPSIKLNNGSFFEGRLDESLKQGVIKDKMLAYENRKNNLKKDFLKSIEMHGSLHKQYLYFPEFSESFMNPQKTKQSQELTDEYIKIKGWFNKNNIKELL